MTDGHTMTHSLYIKKKKNIFHHVVSKYVESYEEGNSLAASS